MQFVYDLMNNGRATHVLLGHF
jgi:hypothetical protein